MLYERSTSRLLSSSLFIKTYSPPRSTSSFRKSICPNRPFLPSGSHKGKASFSSTMSKLDLTIPTFKLPDGSPIPAIGYGTGTAWFKKDATSPLDQKLIEATKTAIGMGYTHLDGAEVYQTEEELGAAIKQSKVDRGKLFVTTKVFGSIEDIPNGIDASLKKLGLEYVDLYLIHAPFFAKSEEDLQTKWAQMEDVLASGKAKSIGVSNYLRKELEATLKTAKVRPAVNQIEYHPYLQHGDLIAYQKNQDVRVAAYGPLTPVTKASDGPLTPYLDGLAKKYGVNPGEILLRWCLEKGVIAITTSSKEQRMSDMLRTMTFQLTPREVDEITEIGNTHHFRGFWNHKFDKDDRS